MLDSVSMTFTATRPPCEGGSERHKLTQLPVRAQQLTLPDTRPTPDRLHNPCCRLTALNH